MKRLAYISCKAAVLILAAFSGVYALDVAPFSFAGVASDSQQDYWDNLVKYKLFATGSSGENAITIYQNSAITDSVGYVGSAKGNLYMSNGNITLGGPLLFGGTFDINAGSHEFISGPGRFLKYFAPTSANGTYRGSYCFDGGYGDVAKSGVQKGSGVILSNTECKNDDVVPFVETVLDVPVPQYASGVFNNASSISASNSITRIEIPPETADDSGVKDLYFKSINLDHSGKVYVVMPPNPGRLTRIFLEESITLDGTAGLEIDVVYATDESEWNGSKWNISDANLKPASNADYSGSLLIYTPKDLSFASAATKNFQGSYISGGDIYVNHNTSFAGQLIAKKITIESDFKANDFNFVPIDPPWVDFGDPKASSWGTIYEGKSGAQQLNAVLTKAATTEVSFDYCFLFDATASVADIVDSYDFVLCASDNSKSNRAVFKKGTTSLSTPIRLEVFDDNLSENTESFKIRIFNLTGAVLSNGARTGTFTIDIVDDDVSPVGLDTVVTGYEDEILSITAFPAKTKSGSALSTYDVRIISLPSKGTLTLSGTPVTKNQTIAFDALKNLAYLGEQNDFASPYTSFEFKVINDKGIEALDVNTLTINLLPVNDAPVINTTVVTIDEGSKKGSVADNAINAIDIDDIASDLVFSLEDDSKIFSIDSLTGLIFVSGDVTLDRDVDSLYVVKVIVRDPGGAKDTALVTVKVIDEPETVKAVKVYNGTQTFAIVNDTARINLNSADISWLVSRNEATLLKDTTYYTGLLDSCYAFIYSYGVSSVTRDTVFVCVSTQSPQVVLTPVGYTLDSTSGFTLEEGSDDGFFVNTIANDFVVTVKDPLTGGVLSDTIYAVTLDSVKVSASTMADVKKIQESFFANEPDSVVRYQENGLIATTYTQIVQGKTVTVKYYATELENGEYEPVLDSSGKELLYVTYETVVNGDTVFITYLADALTGGRPLAEDSSYTLSYTHTDKAGHVVTVSYAIDENGAMVIDKSLDKVYTLTYTYTNAYGNSATNSVVITLDQTFPIVKILSPDSNSTVYSVSVKVVWTVDGIEQDSLTLQNLEKGKNVIIRSFRDKAGNEASDTVVVYMKNGKNVVIKVKNPVSGITDSTKAMLDSYYADNPLAGEYAEKGYAISFENPRSGEYDALFNGNSVYSKDSSLHFGPTLGISVMVPAVSENGGLQKLSDLLEYGKVSLNPDKGKYAEYVDLETFVNDYCDAEFNATYAKNKNATSLYTINFKAHIWVFTSLGQYVNDFSFEYVLSDLDDYVDDNGFINMNFELMPDTDGALRAPNGRLLGTGAYLFKSELKSSSKLHCCVDTDGDGTCEQPKAKRRVSNTEEALQSFGYKHPLLK